jgi:hypothetical protein
MEAALPARSWSFALVGAHLVTWRWREVIFHHRILLRVHNHNILAKIRLVDELGAEVPILTHDLLQFRTLNWMVVFPQRSRYNCVFHWHGLPLLAVEGDVTVRSHQ